MLRKPRVVASEKSMFAPTSQRPTVSERRQRRRPGRNDAPTTSAATSASSSDDAAGGRDRIRDALVGGPVREDEVEPEAERGDQRQADPGGAAAALCDGSREATATPTSASRMPTTCSTLGRSPDATPTANGITAATAETGATIPIAPTAIPR